MNHFEVTDLTTSGQLEEGNPSVEIHSPSILVGMERSGTQFVERSSPLHIPRNDALGRGSWEWWMQPQKIGTWTTNDVLSLPDGLGGWIYEPSDFNIRVGMYMAKYGQEDSFPYVMSNMWNKPPPVPPRFKMMWYDMVMSCVHPAIVVTGERPIHYDYGIIPVNELKFANRCVAIVSQWHQFPIVDGYMKAQRNMASYVPQAKMLGAQYPVMIGLLVMEKELRIVFETLNNYLAYMAPKFLRAAFPNVHALP